MNRTRRERVRDATLREIKDTARKYLLAGGPSGISLRAIARDMGMTAPALYRYYASLDDLISAMIEDYKNEVSDVLERARDAVPADDPLRRLLEMTRAFRDWALGHQPEFTLVFGAPVPGHEQKERKPTDAGGRFGGIFFALFAELWQRNAFPVPADDEISPDLRRQLTEFGKVCGAAEANIPIGLLRMFAGAWVRLYGLITMEIFGHGRFMFNDGEPLFEAELAELGGLLSR